jgi:Xaa-Pro aminopeptidase
MAEQKSALIGPEVFVERRNRIREAVGGGLILWLGHIQQPRNYVANTYPFRQNSHFLYYTGLAQPDLVLISYPERDFDVLFSRAVTMDDVVWSGAGNDRVEMARRAGVETVENIDRLGAYLTRARSQGLHIHYPPPYQASSLFRLAELLVVEPAEVTAGASQRLIREVVCQRSIKSEAEIAEIEDALGITADMYRLAMAETRPGIHEYDIAGVMQGVALKRNRQQAFLPIVTVRGEVLHNEFYDNLLQDGKLLVIDSGAESPNYYASDITRTIPVNGRFSPAQAEIYRIVLKTQMSAIESVRPGVSFKEVHLHACRVMAEGLQEIGLMKGNAADAVAAGAHALLFVHGLGHMLGLDVHDMEDLGDAVGYAEGEKRSTQFGLNFLRLTRVLEPGMVVTIEPGIYFIPALIDRWIQERTQKEFINYDRLPSFRSLGGIRIEDDVLVTESGSRVLGPGIAKTVAEVEAAMA